MRNDIRNIITCLTTLTVESEPGLRTEREAFVEAKRAEYRADIDLLRIASDLHLDAIVDESDLREDLIRRFAYAQNKTVAEYPRRRYVVPV